jgi:hypothetical protein
MFTFKNEPLSQEIHLKILHLSSGLKMSRVVEKLLFTFFVKQIPPTDSWHQFNSDRCNFHPLMPALTLVALLERYLWFKIASPRGDIGNRPFEHS